MKHLLSAIILVIAFTTVQSQTCGNLTITNFTPDDYTFAWVTGDGSVCNTMVDSYDPGYTHITATSATLSPFSPTVTTLTAPHPGFFDWMGVHVIAVNTAPVSDPYPNSWTSSACYWTGSSYNIVWTSACSIEIYP